MGFSVGLILGEYGTILGVICSEQSVGLGRHLGSHVNDFRKLLYI